MRTQEPPPSESAAHRLYRWLRPRLYDLGVLRVLRWFFPAPLRRWVAIRLGLSGFQTLQAQSKYVPGWMKTRRAAPVTSLAGVNYVGDLRADIGLSEHSRRNVTMLQAAGLEVAYIEREYQSASRTSTLPPDLLTTPRFDVTVVDVNFPHFYEAFRELPPAVVRDKYIVAVWAWELNRFPPESVHNFQFVNEVWVSSAFTQSALREISPVPVIRMPFGFEVTADTSVDRSMFGLPAKTFVFLFAFDVNSSVARKNPFAIIAAFRRAFGRGSADGPLLVIKAHHLDNSHVYTPALRAALEAELADINGVLLTDKLTRQQMNGLIAASDCIVSLHRSEGFGLLMAEAMTLGKPVIATAYGGNVDFMTPNNSYLVRCQVRPITEADHQHQPGLASMYPPGYVWAEPDVEQAAALMHTVYTDRDAALRIGQQAAETMRLHYTPQVTGAQMRLRLEQIAQQR